MSSLQDRIESESSSVKRITNKDLVCKDCVFALDDSVKLRFTSQCKAYLLKPTEVLLGGSCKLYKKKGG